MFARVLHVQVAPERVDAVVEAYRAHVRPIHAQARGLRHHYVLVDRDTGVVQIIGVWESADDIQRIGPVLEPARARLWEEFGMDPALEVFEVADEL